MSHFARFDHLDPDKLEAATDLILNVLQDVLDTGRADGSTHLLNEAPRETANQAISLMLGMLVGAIDDQARALGIPASSFIHQFRHQTRQAVARMRARRN